MRGPTLGALPILVALGLTGCGVSRSPAGHAGHQRATSGASIAATSQVAVAAEAAPAAHAAPVAAPTGQRGSFCKVDADCGWDDPCRPQRCGAVAARPATGCGNGLLPPGTCTCVEQQCTWRPTDRSRGASAPGCRTDDECAIDVGAATCHLGGGTSIGPIVEEGPVCTCAAGSGRCEWGWAGPVPCKSWRDCSWVRTPRLRPVPARQQNRPVPHPVKPCEEGEVDSVCGPQGTCRIVSWSC